jgi:hypothetical protein
VRLHRRTASVGEWLTACGNHLIQTYSDREIPSTLNKEWGEVKTTPPLPGDYLAPEPMTREESIEAVTRRTEEMGATIERSLLDVATQAIDLREPVTEPPSFFAVPYVALLRQSGGELVHITPLPTPEEIRGMRRIVFESEALVIVEHHSSSMHYMHWPERTVRQQARRP